MYVLCDATLFRGCHARTRPSADLESRLAARFALKMAITDIICGYNLFCEVTVVSMLLHDMAEREKCKQGGGKDLQ